MYLNNEELKGHYFTNFFYRMGFSERNLHDKRGTTVYQSIAYTKYHLILKKTKNLVIPSFLQVIKYGEPLDELQKDELRSSVEKLRRQMLRKSREYDCQILQERMELLHQAHQVILPKCIPRPIRSVRKSKKLFKLFKKQFLSVYREFVTLKTRQRSREGRLKTWKKR